MTAPTPLLCDEERQALLRLARESLTHYVRTGKPLPSVRQEVFAAGEASQTAFNCFVSLHKRGQLRGCIGTLAASEPLFRQVASSAISAGARDPRFPAVTLDELKECDFEISVLGPFGRVASVEEIEVGRHGLLVESEVRRGLLLPQVATQYGWTAREFLRQTYVKAGLPPQIDIGGVETVSVFTACVFGEKDYPGLLPG